MTILFPQWQGSGQSNEIELGSYVLGDYFSDLIDYKVPLRNEEFHLKNNIIFYDTLFKQLKSYRDLLDKTIPEKITTIGGDCGVEIIPVSYLNNKYRNIGIVWLDAHADLNTPLSSPGKTFHGMPLRLLLGEGDTGLKNLLYSYIKPQQVFYIGLRDIDDAEKEYLNENSMFHVRDINYDKSKTKIRELNFKQIYIHLDLDVLKPSEYKYVKCPVERGLTIRELEQLIYDLQNDFEVVGYSICESTAKDLNSIAAIENILELIKKGSMCNK